MISLVGVPASTSELVVLVLDITEQERRRQAERSSSRTPRTSCGRR
jgi:hypothetical protein